MKLFVVLICSVLLAIWQFIPNVEYYPKKQEVYFFKDSETYHHLAKILHGAKDVDRKALKEVFSALLTRLQAEKMEKSIPPLKQAINTLAKASPVELYQHVMVSWYFADPEKALNFLFLNTSQGITVIQTKEATSDQIATSYVDYRLLLHFLNYLIDLNGDSVLSYVLKDLSEKISWVKAEKRRDFIYFTLTLELEWLRTILLVRSTTLATISQTVDFEVEFQYKTMLLFSFRGEKDYAQMIDLLTSMQTQMAMQVLKGLASLKSPLPRLATVKTLLESVVNLAPSQVKEPLETIRVLSLLKRASAILDSVLEAKPKPEISMASPSQL